MNTTTPNPPPPRVRPAYKRVAETEIMLSDLERLAEKDVDARNTSGFCTVGINMSGSHMGFDKSSGMADIGAHSIAADGMVSTSLSWHMAPAGMLKWV